MKTILKLIVTLFFSIYWISCTAQYRINANPAVLNAELLFNSTVHVGEFSFEYSHGAELKSFDKDQPVKMTICFMNVIPADQEMLIGGELAQYFEWSYIENLNCIRGVQQKHIAVREPMDCKIVVKTKESESLANDANIGFITNIQPAPKMNNTNKTDDDAVSNYKKVATVENLIIAENEKN